jgi:hypothetical protein
MQFGSAAPEFQGKESIEVNKFDHLQKNAGQRNVV